MTVSMPSSEVVFHHTIGLPAEILSHLTARDFGSYACTSKASYVSSHHVFLAKGRELGIRPKPRVDHHKEKACHRHEQPTYDKQNRCSQQPCSSALNI